MAMSDAPVAANLNKALDVEVNFSPEFAFNLVLLVNNFSETVNFLFSQFIYSGIRIDTGLSENFLTQDRTNAVNIL